MKIRSRVFPLVVLMVIAWSHVDAQQTVYLDVSELIPKTELSFSPRTASFIENSTFDIPILVNTKGANINGIEVRISYDQDKLEIVKPSSGLSIIGVWVEPPSYDNARGTASYVGVITNGLTTSAGLVGTITFRAKSTGKAIISISPNSKVLLNDGQGTEAPVDWGRAEYTILPKAPEGVNVFSETHPFQSEWYNNNSPIVSWDRDSGISGFSYILDNKPFTIPENTINTNETTKSFENLDDGLWYFHIKANKSGVWGTTGHFLMRIDTAPPAEFKPKVDYLVAALILNERALVSFFTTDNLSGIDHYEVGVIDKSQPATVSPVFVQTESPFQVPLTSGNLNVVVRAFDKAGNVRDTSVSLGKPALIGGFIKYILSFVILISLIGLALRYPAGQHVKRDLLKVVEWIKKEGKPVIHKIIQGIIQKIRLMTKKL